MTYCCSLLQILCIPDIFSEMPEGFADWHNSKDEGNQPAGGLFHVYSPSHDCFGALKHGRSFHSFLNQNNGIHGLDLDLNPPVPEPGFYSLHCPLVSLGVRHTFPGITPAIS